MDRASGFDDELIFDQPLDEAAEDGLGDPDFAIGADERRMHVRAYNHWVSLLRGQPFPSIHDLDVANTADFGPHSVLLDFTGGVENPSIRFLGRSLSHECGLDHTIKRISDVPSRSLLSRLTDHYLQIIANRAPIGFEAEFVNTRGNTTLYRGILTPFSSDGEVIDFIYGVINWKELADELTHASIAAELELAPPPAPVDGHAWADGPSAAPDAVPEVPLADQLEMARESAAAASAADTRSRAALYRALGRAHDFAIAAQADEDGFHQLLAEARITRQARAPMTPLVKLVFGANYDKKRLTEFATLLAAAREAQVPEGGIAEYIDGHRGGIKGIVSAARARRRPLPPLPAPTRQLTALAHVPLDLPDFKGEMVVLVARRSTWGGLDVVGAVTDNAALIRQAVAALR